MALILVNEPASIAERRKREGRIFRLGLPSQSPPYLVKPVMSFRQTVLYQDLCDLWRPERPMTAAGVSGEPVYRRVATGIPCFLDRHPSASQLERFGRIEQDDLFTRDIWNFAEDQEVADAWCIVCKSVRPGTTIPNGDWGRAWMTAGDSQLITDNPDRMVGRVIISAIGQSALPETVEVGP